MANTANIVVATFDEESKTYQAFSEIKQLGARREVQVKGLAVVRKTADGRLDLADMTSRGYGGSLAGGLIGSLVGILGGPLGILLGWGAGALIGSIRDFHEARSDITLLQRLSEGMNPGNVALIGEIEEPSTGPVNMAVTRLGGEVLRRPAEEVEDEVAAAERAREAAEQEARRVMDERNRERSGDEGGSGGLREGLEHLKDRLTGDDRDDSGTDRRDHRPGS